MAVIQYSGLITQIRGKLAGTVFSKFAGGYNMYRKPQPRKVGSDNQQASRVFWAAFAGVWRTLTEMQRQDWRFVANNTPVYNRLGELTTINGFAWYMRYNQFLRDAGLGIRRSIATTLNPAYALSMTVDQAIVDLQDDGFYLATFDATLTVIASSVNPNVAVLYASQPQPYPDFQYHQSWYRFAIVPIAANVAEESEIAVNLSNILMPRGWRWFENGFTRFKLECVNLESAQWSPGATSTDQVTPEPPVSFPTLATPDPLAESALMYLGPTGGYWLLYWARTAGTENPADYQIELGLRVAAASEPSPETLDYLTMGTFSLVVNTPFSVIYPGNPSEIDDMGFAAVNAYSGNLPAWTGGQYAWLRARLIHIATNTPGPYWYTGYDYVAI